jgi:hypothetical protein
MIRKKGRKKVYIGHSATIHSNFANKTFEVQYRQT